VSRRPVAVPVASLDALGPVVSIGEVMGVYHVPSYDALLRQVKARRVPAPFASRPARWRKSDLVADLGPVAAFGRRKAS
jgi:hypothetical protein